MNCLWETEYCKALCTKKLNRADPALFRKRIHQLYRNMIADNLPGATEIPPALSGEEDNIFYETGGQLAGIIARIREEKSLNVALAKERITYNHLSMKIEYHKPEKNMFSDTITTTMARLCRPMWETKIR